MTKIIMIVALFLTACAQSINADALRLAIEACERAHGTMRIVHNAMLNAAVCEKEKP